MASIWRAPLPRSPRDRGFQATEEALQEFRGRRPGWLSESVKWTFSQSPPALCSSAEDLLRFRREGRHVLTAARAGADQHQAPDQIRGLQAPFLSDEAPIEKPSTSTSSVRALMNAMALAPHFLERVGTSPELLDTPALSEQDHFSILGQAGRSQQGPNGPWCR